MYSRGYGKQFPKFMFSKGSPPERVHHLNKVGFFLKSKLNKPFSQFSNYIPRLKHNCLTSVDKSLLSI